MPSVDHAGASIAYEVTGSGPTVVFAHGAGGNGMSWWQQVPSFAQRYRVVTFDHRCFGRSRCAHDDFHPKHFTGDLLAILDAIGAERAALVCQSMGGWTGLPTALRHPDRVSCLVLGDTPGGLLTPGIAAAMARIGAGASESGIRGNAALAPDFPEREPALAFLYDQINGLNTGFSPALLARMGDPEVRIDPGALADYRVPTLLLAGEHDALFPLECLRELGGLIPGAELREFPGVGHSTYFEAPSLFNQVVGEFVAKHAAG